MTCSDHGLPFGLMAIKIPNYWLEQDVLRMASLYEFVFTLATSTSTALAIRDNTL